MLGVPRRWGRRWFAPLTTCCAVAAIAVVPGAVTIGHDRPDLPPRSSDSLLLLLTASRVNTLSGTVVESADLGLPELPRQSTGGGTGDILTSLLTGSHTIRVWQSGTDRQRISVLDQLAETDLARRGSTVWTYQSSTNVATLGTLSTLADSQILQILLRNVLLPIVTGPDSVVTAGPTDRVAGRDAYTLVVRPKRPDSLVDHLELTIDAEQGTLLRFRLYAEGMSTPALQARFTSISFRPPAERLFAPVATDPPPTPATPPPAAQSPPAGPNSPTNPVSTIGYGWSAITRITGSNLARSASSLFATVTKPIPGGRVLATPLLSVLITSGGDVYVGAVPLPALEAQAGL